MKSSLSYLFLSVLRGHEYLDLNRALVHQCPGASRIHRQGTGGGTAGVGPHTSLLCPSLPCPTSQSCLKYVSPSRVMPPAPASVQNSRLYVQLQTQYSHLDLDGSFRSTCSARLLQHVDSSRSAFKFLEPPHPKQNSFFLSHSIFRERLFCFILNINPESGQ